MDKEEEKEFSTGSDIVDLITTKMVVHIECIGPDGNVKWTDTVEGILQ